MKTDYDFNVFCDNFAKLRKTNSLTINDISKATNISIWELASIEVGAQPENISCASLLKLCNYFNVSLNNIFTPI